MPGCGSDRSRAWRIWVRGDCGSGEPDREPQEPGREMRKPGRSWPPRGEGARPAGRRGRAFGSAGVRAQSIGTLTLAELAHHLALDLAHPLAREAEQFADL